MSNKFQRRLSQMGCKSRFHVDIMDLHDSVTGSCHLLVVTFPDSDDEKLKFVVDCGMFQKEEEKNENNASFPFNPSGVSFCLITHAHVDHIGRLPLLAKKGFSGKVYATETTCKILPEALRDCWRISKSKSKDSGMSMAYDEEDVQTIVHNSVPCQYRAPIKVHDRIDVYFFRNCHLPGASIILVKIKYPGEEDINILFTGDYNDKSSFQPEVSIPQWVLDLPLTIIQESTYGTTNTQEIVPCFENNFLKAIGERKTILCLVFSLARAQEILYILRKLQDEGKLDPNIPIYLDGKLAIKYTNMYAKGELDINPEMCDFLPENLTWVDKPVRNVLLEESSCKVILTSSGMGSYGPARTYIPAFLERKDVIMHFTGYTAIGTLGRKLKDTPKGETVEVAGMVLRKRADIEYTSEFSAHAKADTMIKFLKQFTNLKLVLVNHGEQEVKKAFAARILDEVTTKNVGILDSSTLFRINTWGCIKTIPTKFI